MALLPALAIGLGAYLGGKKKAKTANEQNQYAYDQARRDYEAQQMAEQEADQRKLDGIDFLQSVALGKGFNIPEGAFAALKQRGVFKGMPSDQRFIKPPKSTYGISDALGVAANTFGDIVAKNQMARANEPPGSYAAPKPQGTSSLFPADTDPDLLEYYMTLAKGGVPSGF